MKINVQLHNQQKKEFALSFTQWLDHFSKEPTSKELDDMESEVQKNKPQNNPYYHPLQEA